MAERPHGYARYKLDGCRCYICGYAASEYRANVERQKAYGTWQPLVDAEPVRAHVRMLSEAGVGWKRVAKLAGISSGSFTKLMFGVKSQGRPPSTKVRSETAKKILAIEPSIDTLADRAFATSLGTVRRLHALVRRGWPQSELAARLGMSPGNFAVFIKRPQVTAASARAVRDLYDRLQNQNPTEFGVSAYGRTRAVNDATRAGWPLPAMWDDNALDDPDAFPDWTGECGSVRGYSLHYNRRILPACDPCKAARAESRTTAALVAASP